MKELSDGVGNKEEEVSGLDSKSESDNYEEELQLLQTKKPLPKSISVEIPPKFPLQPQEPEPEQEQEQEQQESCDKKITTLPNCASDGFCRTSPSPIAWWLLENKENYFFVVVDQHPMTVQIQLESTTIKVLWTVHGKFSD